MAADRPAKIGIIGAGSVGATIAYAAMIRGVARQISLFDIARSKVDAEVLDLNHGLLFVPQGTVEGSDDIEILLRLRRDRDDRRSQAKPWANAHGPGRANAAICAKLLPGVVHVAPDAMFLLVTNPVDVITQVAIKMTGLPWERVFGSGTVLDSSRFRYLVAKHCHVAVQNVHAYIAGEHGDSEIPLWSSATIGSIPLSQWAVKAMAASPRPTRTDRAQRQGRRLPGDPGQRRNQLRHRTGGHQYSRSAPARRAASAPVERPARRLSRTRRRLPSLPRIVSRKGIEAPLPIPMTVDEEAGLQR